jgi:hypothetical protein
MHITARSIDLVSVNADNEARCALRTSSRMRSHHHVHRRASVTGNTHLNSRQCVGADFIGFYCVLSDWGHARATQRLSHRLSTTRQASAATAMRPLVRATRRPKDRGYHRAGRKIPRAHVPPAQLNFSRGPSEITSLTAVSK